MGGLTDFGGKIGIWHLEVTLSLAGDSPKTFTMWGPEKQLPPGFSRDRLNDQQLLTEHGVRPYAGDMVLGVKWMPENSKKPDAGVDSEKGREGAVFVF